MGDSERLRRRGIGAFGGVGAANRRMPGAVNSRDGRGFFLWRLEVIQLVSSAWGFWMVGSGLEAWDHVILMGGCSGVGSVA